MPYNPGDNLSFGEIGEIAIQNLILRERIEILRERFEQATEDPRLRQVSDYSLQQAPIVETATRHLGSQPQAEQHLNRAARHYLRS